ncbi:phospholipase D-like domain-containing protein [Flavobacterium sp.]|uniref:phospholipase D-like domain-containing protein n=1 Tax=Flavobacterium sp. TaxID=239 RepID=UPI00286CDDB2|nr:phospholipase D-like domain-containing protein [Flavobacterium sp.]
MLKNTKPFALWCALLLVTTFSFSQSVKEQDYTLTYQSNALELQFDSAVTLKAFNNTDASEIAVASTSKPNAFSINTHPAEIIRLEYKYNSDHNVHTSYVAAPSLSSGTIDVYFNHPVDVSFAQTQNAVNLSNTLDDKLITYINACQSTLDIAIYNSYSSSVASGIAGAINAAYNRGVQVRVIYDGSTSSIMISLLNVNIPRLASPTAVEYGIMHNKFVIFDAHDADANRPYVWTGSTNWTTSQIDGPDRNSVILLQDQALALGYTIEFEEMWGSNTMTPNATLSRFGPYKTDNTPHTYNLGGKIVNNYFSPSDGTNAKIVTAIYSANTDIDIATMLITRSSLSNAIISRYNSGVTNVNVVVDQEVVTGNQIANLQAGLPANHAVEYSSGGIMHHKFMVVDNFNSASDPQVVVGSHNWSTAAETKNDENTLIVHNANIANQYYQAFAYLYAQAGGTLSVTQQQWNGREVTVYPNPAQDYVLISGLNTGMVEIYSMSGAKLYNAAFNNDTRIPLDLASGIYMMKITSDNNSIVKKLMVR